MRRARLVALGLVVVAGAVTVSATRFRGAAERPPVVTREVIAVYLGTKGTDAGMGTVVRGMKSALVLRATESGRHFISRGVSLEPGVDSGMAHLAQLGPFDEVSVGGNWTNSAVVRYLGGSIGKTRETAIPQVVLLEREVRQDKMSLEIGAERELGRYIGTKEIADWVKKGAPIP